MADVRCIMGNCDVSENNGIPLFSYDVTQNAHLAIRHFATPAYRRFSNRYTQSET